MRLNDKISNCSGKASCNVPEGYFEDLRTRLEAIPSGGVPRRGVLRRLEPYLDLAACFAAMVIAGNLVLRRTAVPADGTEDWGEAAYAEFIHFSYPDDLPEVLSMDRDTITEEDVVNYLIATGTPAEMIEYAGLVAQK